MSAEKASLPPSSASAASSARRSSGLGRGHLLLDERDDLLADARDGARRGAANVVAARREEREDLRERLLRADPRERVERVHLEERHAALEHGAETLDDARAPSP